jgi:hypothetical protein
MLELRAAAEQRELHDDEARPEGARRVAEERVEDDIFGAFDVELDRIDAMIAFLARGIGGSWPPL